uniref:NADH:ubiquinone oxidoreductase complex assembly factor 8 n=1 Tax=Sarcophilus harrisii TaxID=9305 RepID=A0A7N4PR87_SARHA
MSGTGAVWSRVRSRIRSFPERLATCGAEAAAYGKCVQAAAAPGGELRRNLCAKEFEALRNCFVAVVRVAAGLAAASFSRLPRAGAGEGKGGAPSDRALLPVPA